MKRISYFTITTLIASLSMMPASASEEDDLAEMQRQLNADVMSRPFDPSDAAKVDAYIEASMKKNVTPRAVAPSYWQPGYTCRDLRRYSYRDYRDCRYYHRYYGRYW